MKKFILGIVGIASIFLATNVFAVGTATVKFDTLTVGTTLTLGSANLAKVPVMTDNAGSKFDSGSLTITSGSQTVTTSLTACDRPFISLNVSSTGTVTTTYRVSTSGAGFTIYIYDLPTGATSTSNYTGHWLAIDE